MRYALDMDNWLLFLLARVSMRCCTIKVVRILVKAIMALVASLRNHRYLTMRLEHIEYGEQRTQVNRSHFTGVLIQPVDMNSANHVQESFSRIRSSVDWEER